jgi:hypothetical protein
MPWVSGAFDRVKHAFDLYFNRKNKCHFLQVPQDVFVDDIFPYLLIDDLLELRKVTSPNYYYYLPVLMGRIPTDLQRNVPFDAPPRYLEEIYAPAASPRNPTPPESQAR